MEKKTGRIAGAVLAAVLAAIYFFMPVPAWMSEGRTFRCALTHHFWHAGILHLAANCSAILALSFANGKWYRALPAAYLAASVSIIFACRPTIGFSNIIFALSGIMSSGIRGYWQSPGTWIFITAMFATLAMPGVSAPTHIASFVAGFLMGAVSLKIRRVAYDSRRARG